MFNAYKETLTVNVLINKCYSFLLLGKVLYVGICLKNKLQNYFIFLKISYFPIETQQVAAVHVRRYNSVIKAEKGRYVWCQQGQLSLANF